MKSITFTIVLILFLGSCTIEKRLYNKGFHVEYHKKSGKVKETESAKNSGDIKETIREEEVALVPEVEDLNRKKAEISLPKKEDVQLRKHPGTIKNKLQEKTLVPEQKRTTTAADQSRQLHRLLLQRFNKTTEYRQSQQKSARQSRGSGISEEAFEFLAGALLLTLLLLCIAFPTFGAIVEMIVGIVLLILLVVGVVWVIVWLCTADFGNFPWFWSGR